MFHERQDPGGHEPCRPDRRPAACHLGYLDDASTMRHLDATSRTCGHDVVRARRPTRVDDDLHAITLHACVNAVKRTLLPSQRRARREMSRFVAWRTGVSLLCAERDPEV